MLPSSCNQPLTHFRSTSLQDNSARDDDIRGLITDAFGLDVQNLGESSSIQETVGMFDGCTHTECIMLRSLYIHLMMRQLVITP